MGHPHLTPGRRLFLFLMDGGGSRTLTEINRRNADGRLLARGRKELGDLIAEEKGLAARAKRPVTRIVITTRGWAAAAELRPGWEPKRRTLDALKAELAERQRENDSWACRFQKDAEDAALWRCHQEEVKNQRRACRLREWAKRAGTFGPKTYEEHKKQIADRARAAELARRVKLAVGSSTETVPIIPPAAAQIKQIREPIAAPIPAPAPTRRLPPGGFCEAATWMRNIANARIRSPAVSFVDTLTIGPRVPPTFKQPRKTHRAIQVSPRKSDGRLHNQKRAGPVRRPMDSGRGMDAKREVGGSALNTIRKTQRRKCSLNRPKSFG